MLAPATGVGGGSSATVIRMSDLDDLDFRQESQDTIPVATLEENTPGRNRTWAILAAGVLLLAIVGYFVFLREPGAPALTEPVAGTGTKAPAAADPAPAPGDDEATVAGPAPSLEASDVLVREVVSGLTSHPRIVTWLATPELLRIVAATVENIATGLNPVPHLGFLAPSGGFQVQAENGVFRADKASFRRYDLVTAVFTSLDPEGCAAAYRRLRPLIEEAFADLGYPGQAFEPTLEQAFANILAVRIPANSPRLEKRVTTWAYADARLEALRPLQKQLLRMGPGNARRVQNHVRHLAAALGMDP